MRPIFYPRMKIIRQSQPTNHRKEAITAGRKTTRDNNSEVNMLKRILNDTSFIKHNLMAV